MSRILIRILILGIVLCGFLNACTKKIQDGEEAKEVNLSIWGNYLTPELQAKFEKDTGIKIKISNYSSNEELLAKVQMGSSGIDVAVPGCHRQQSRHRCPGAVRPDAVTPRGH